MRAALAMRAAMGEYSAQLARRELPALAVGIGIHRGSGRLGLGSRNRMEYDFVGPTWTWLRGYRNSRAPIRWTSSLPRRCGQLDTRFVLAPMPAEPVKGIAEPVVTYAARQMATVSAPAAD